jgi:hypothetical protein
MINEEGTTEKIVEESGHVYLRWYSEVCMDELKKTMMTLTQDRRCLRETTPECKREESPLQSTCSAIHFTQMRNCHCCSLPDTCLAHIRLFLAAFILFLSTFHIQICIIFEMKLPITRSFSAQSASKFGANLSYRIQPSYKNFEFIWRFVWQLKYLF